MDEGYLEVFAFGGDWVRWGGHSVEDHYLHNNWIIFWRGVDNFFFFFGGGGAQTGLQEALWKWGAGRALYSLLYGMILKGLYTKKQILIQKNSYAYPMTTYNAMYSLSVSVCLPVCVCVCLSLSVCLFQYNHDTFV